VFPQSNISKGGRRHLYQPNIESEGLQRHTPGLEVTVRPIKLQLLIPKKGVRLTRCPGRAKSFAAVVSTVTVLDVIENDWIPSSPAVALK
jgi:hypothetical protein